MNWLTSEPTDKLRTILGPIPTTPWAALLPQAILLAFRNFCLEHLYDADVAALREYMWDDMAEFLDRYSPKGLDASKWLDPEHVDEVYSGLQAYNDFCSEVMQQFDAALMDENVQIQDAISDFLDNLHEPVYAWLGDSRFNIFPSEFEEGVSPEVLKHLANSLEAYSKGIVESDSELEVEELPAIELEPEEPQRSGSLLRKTLRVGRRSFTPVRSGTRRARVAVKVGDKLLVLDTE